jgi:putative ABC transport system permease protein
VLAGATAASQRAHIYDAVVLKLLGGTRPIILASLIIEYMALGLAAGLAAAGLGSAAAWVVVVPVMNMTWGFDGGVLAVTLAFSIGLTVLLGLLGTGAALNARPAWALRSLAR